MVVYSNPVTIFAEEPITWLGWCYSIKFTTLTPSTIQLYDGGNVIAAIVNVRYFAAYNDGSCEIQGDGYANTEVVRIHLDSPTGPVVGQAACDLGGNAYFNSYSRTAIVIPLDTPPGEHTLYAEIDNVCYDLATCRTCTSDFGGCG